ncbi:MAG TPA: hypothetical protein VL651_10180 [Bacteroidia bacterium]|nr:hypothetical protein [Bacteroidia bacterium]
MATTATVGDKLAGFLRKTATGIEKLQVELALGKAAAADKYEEVKKKLHRFVTDKKAEIGTASRRNYIVLRAEMDDLLVQLSLGKAETRDAFISQKKKIVRAINNLEAKLKGIFKKSGFEEELLHEMEAARIKFEMLQVQFALGRMEAKQEFEKRKHDLRAIVSKTKAHIAKKEFAERRQRYYAEIKEAYKNLRKSFVKS